MSQRDQDKKVKILNFFKAVNNLVKKKKKKRGKQNLLRFF